MEKGTRGGVDILVGVMRLRIDLAYDGGGFFGWAKQPTIRTVQGEIERVLHTITRVPVDDPAEPLRLTVAGRTDTGVHASHQVCHLDIGEETLSRCVGHMSVPPTVALKHRLQRMLPADITIHDVTVAPSGFDARFSALERTYVYRVADRASEVDPRLRGFVLHLDADGKEVRTDENNFVVDLHLERIDHPQDLAEDLINTVGVVEHGLFLNMVDKVIVGDPNGPRVMTNGNK